MSDAQSDRDPALDPDRDPALDPDRDPALDTDGEPDRETDHAPTAEPGRPLKATALSYERGDRAPRIVASGSGEVAKRIVELAEAAGVPVRSDPALAAALDALKIEAEIPAELYKAVAEALAWAYKVDGTIAEQRRQNRH